jgi:hypothetical protein
MDLRRPTAPVLPQLLVVMGSRDGGDLGTGGDSELQHLHGAECAACPSHQYPPAEQLAAEAQGAQRGQAGKWQRGDLLEADWVGHGRQSRGRHGGQSGPPGLLHERDDAATGRRTRAVGGRFNNYAGHVLARTPLIGARLQQGELAAVDRECPHSNQRLIGGRVGIRDIGDAGSIGRVQHGFHGMPVLLCVGGMALGRVTVASVVRRH